MPNAAKFVAKSGHTTHWVTVKGCALGIVSPLLSETEQIKISLIFHRSRRSLPNTLS